MSAPAMNVRPAAAITTALTEGSFASGSKVAEQAFVHVLADGVYRRVVDNDDSDIRGIGWPLDLHDVVHAARSLT